MGCWRVLVVCSVLLVGCGSGGDGGVVRAEAVPVGESGYLRDAYRNRGWLLPASVTTSVGLFVFGGVRRFGEATEVKGAGFEVIEGGVMVGSDGTAVPLPVPPSGPLVNVVAALDRDSVVVVGLRCSSGIGPSDGVDATCGDPGGLRALRFDVVEWSWSELSVPASAAGSPVVGHLGVYVGDGVLVLKLPKVGDEEGRPGSWMSVDGGTSWSVTDAPRGMLCGTGGEVLAVEDRSGAIDPSTIGVGDPASIDLETRGLHLVVSRLDVAKGVWVEVPGGTTPSNDVLNRSPMVACLPDAGLLVFALTTIQRDATTVVFRFHHGRWTSFVVDDPGMLGVSVELDEERVVAASVGAPTRLLDLVTGELGPPIGALAAASDHVIGAVDARHLFVVGSEGAPSVVRAR